jgi:hypothetical protein
MTLDSPTVGSSEGGVSYERGIHVDQRVVCVLLAHPLFT